jgi:hypothetical protein
MKMIAKDVDSHKCQECSFSVSLDWADPESELVFCIHPQMGHIGNWVQRIVNAEDKACAHFQAQADLSEAQ